MRVPWDSVGRNASIEGLVRKHAWGSGRTEQVRREEGGWMRTLLKALEEDTRELLHVVEVLPPPVSESEPYDIESQTFEKRALTLSSELRRGCMSPPKEAGVGGKTHSLSCRMH